jgi:hypothetical protein
MPETFFMSRVQNIARQCKLWIQRVLFLTLFSLRDTHKVKADLQEATSENLRKNLPYFRRNTFENDAQPHDLCAFKVHSTDALKNFEYYKKSPTVQK